LNHRARFSIVAGRVDFVQDNDNWRAIDFGRAFVYDKA
jgi:hypothetical protein